ncbi:MAG: bifunctional riboflavin kinase/FAD synthetase [Chitinophagales bacterium]|nr:bifunctional riboflavin kinase/FAD synthetase [Chitinophagales bacterium]
MRVFTNAEHLPAIRNPILTIGTFDGVHLGHQEIITTINQLAKEYDGESVILTFHPHPRLVINPGDTSLKLINTLEEKKALLAKYGVDNLIIVPFSREFSQIPARQYVDDLIWKSIHPKVVVIGYDHRFGKNREGGIELIKAIGNERGFKVLEIEKQTVDDIDVSSTKVRAALADCDIEQANNLLGHHYTLEGIVVKGEQRGRKLGYPTANIQVNDPNKLIPGNGIYAVNIVYAGAEFAGMMSIGTNPTFNNKKQTIEVYIFDFGKEIYGEALKVIFVAYLRPEEKFDSIEALIFQMQQDELAAKNVLNYTHNQLP